jgi:hypothetical protein
VPSVLLEDVERTPAQVKVAARSPVLDRLLEAKAESDRRNYLRKHMLLRQLLREPHGLLRGFRGGRHRRPKVPRGHGLVVTVRELNRLTARWMTFHEQAWSGERGLAARLAKSKAGLEESLLGELRQAVQGHGRLAAAARSPRKGLQERVRPRGPRESQPTSAGAGPAWGHGGRWPCRTPGGVAPTRDGLPPRGQDSSVPGPGTLLPRPLPPLP